MKTFAYRRAGMVAGNLREGPEAVLTCPTSATAWGPSSVPLLDNVNPGSFGFFLLVFINRLLFATCFPSSYSVLVLRVSMSCAPTWSGPTGHANIQEQRDRWENKHNLTTAELLQTERRYCQQLELVTTVGIPATRSSRLNPA